MHCAPIRLHQVRPRPRRPLRAGHRRHRAPRRRKRRARRAPADCPGLVGLQPRGDRQRGRTAGACGAFPSAAAGEGEAPRDAHEARSALVGCGSGAAGGGERRARRGCRRRRRRSARNGASTTRRRARAAEALAAPPCSLLRRRNRLLGWRDLGPSRGNAPRQLEPDWQPSHRHPGHRAVHRHFRAHPVKNGMGAAVGAASRSGHVPQSPVGVTSGQFAGRPLHGDDVGVSDEPSGHKHPEPGARLLVRESLSRCSGRLLCLQTHPATGR